MPVGFPSGFVLKRMRHLHTNGCRCREAKSDLGDGPPLTSQTVRLTFLGTFASAGAVVTPGRGSRVHRSPSCRFRGVPLCPVSVLRPPIAWARSVCVGAIPFCSDSGFADLDGEMDTLHPQIPGSSNRVARAPTPASRLGTPSASVRAPEAVSRDLSWRSPMRDTRTSTHTRSQEDPWLPLPPSR